MLQYFSAIQSLRAEPTPTVNFNGKWRNDLKSEMDLTVDAAGAVTGFYRTGVGSPGNSEEFHSLGSRPATYCPSRSTLAITAPSLAGRGNTRLMAAPRGSAQRGFLPAM